MDKLLEALAEVDRLSKGGGIGIMGSPLSNAKRSLDRAYGEYLRSLV